MQFIEVIIVLMCTLILTDCKHQTQSVDSQKESNPFVSIKKDAVVNLTPTQETAFEALNYLQININGEHLYSTFSGLDHRFNQLDSSYVISANELLIAIKDISTAYGVNLSIEEIHKLSSDAVLAQEKYFVQKYRRNSSSLAPEIWVLPQILGRRDLILIW